MPELSITEPQREQLEAVREDVEDAFVDTYGHTTVEDALDYLLDTYTPPSEAESADSGPYDRIASAEYPELQQIASTVEDIPGSGIGADEMRGKLLTTLGPGELARRLDGVDVEDDDATESGDGIIGSEPDGESTASEADESTASASPETDEGNGSVGAGTDSEATTDARTTEADDGGTGAEATSTGDEATDDGDDADESDDGPGGGNDGPGGVLAAANRLLREHDDKWRKSETSEEPYEVDLPDGTTTGVRTKDDVRQLLFRHY